VVPTWAQPTSAKHNTAPQQTLTHDPAKTMNDLSVRMQDNVAWQTVC